MISRINTCTRPSYALGIVFKLMIWFYLLALPNLSYAAATIVYDPTTSGTAYKRCESKNVTQLDKFSYSAVKGSGATGIPTLNYTAPAGSNRMLIILLSVEREHTPVSNGRGDNFETTFSSTAPSYTEAPKLTYGSTQATPLSLALELNGSTSLANTELSRTVYLYTLMDPFISAGSNAITVNLNSPKSSGDEATLAIATFANAGAIQPMTTPNAVDKTSPFNLSITASPILANPSDQAPGTAITDNLMLAFGSTSTEENLTIGSGWTKLVEIVNSNTTGTFRNSTGKTLANFSENDGHTLIIESITNKSSNVTANITSSSSTQASVGLSVMRIAAHGCDYSDAPASYGIATHPQSWSRAIGTLRGDAEIAPFTAANATGDDTTTNDDEDSTVIPALTRGQTTTVNFKVMGTGFLNVWIDWNKDGDFDEGTERIATDIADSDADGIIPIAITPPANTTLSSTYARIRYSMLSGQTTATGFAPHGEVEDHVVTFTTPTTISGKVWFDYYKDGMQNEEAGAGVEGTKLELFNPLTNTVVATKWTDVDGNYWFDTIDGLQPNTAYQVRMAKPDNDFPLSDWSLTTFNAGKDPALDSDAVVNGNYWQIDLTSPASGIEVAGYGFGLAVNIPQGCLDNGATGTAYVAPSPFYAYNFLFSGKHVSGFCAELTDSSPQANDSYQVNATDRQGFTAAQRSKLARLYSAMHDPDIVFQITSMSATNTMQDNLDLMLKYMTWYYTDYNENISTITTSYIDTDTALSATQKATYKTLMNKIINRVDGLNGETQYPEQTLFWLWNKTTTAHQDIITPARYIIDSTCTAPKTISGIIFEDINFGGGEGRSITANGSKGIAGVTVELYSDTGSFISSTTTDSQGQYTFTPTDNGSYYVRVVNASVKSTRTGSTGVERGVQTYRTDGTTETLNEVGGRTPASVDADANTTNAVLNVSTYTLAAKPIQSIQRVELLDTSKIGVNFGFNFDTIVNTNDSGQGSLRQFIINSNLLSNTGLDQVDNSNDGAPDPAAAVETAIFALKGTAPYTINLTSALPTITDTTMIDGSTQSGASCDTATRSLSITLNGSAAGTNANGLVLNATNSGVRGLAIGGFTASGIQLLANANFANLSCNNIGLDASGSTVKSNTLHGIHSVGNKDLTVGGSNTNQRNLISGNYRDGLRLETVTNATIENNYIGTTQTGTVAASNNMEATSYGGIGTYTNTTNVIIRNNVIAGNNITGGLGPVYNTSNGIRLDKTTKVSVVSNKIGLQPNGLTALENTGSGVYMINGTAQVTIGGLTAAERNLIAGNGDDGIKTNYTTSNVSILGNYIGVNATGNTAVSNKDNGIFLSDSSTVTIGNGTAAGRNIIAANGISGIRNSASSNTIIADNFVGTDSTGATALGNGLHGIYVQNSAGVKIGGTAATDANIVSANKVIGIFIVGATSNTTIQNNIVGILADGNSIAGNISSGIETNATTGVTITSNTISSNGTRGIHIINSPTTTITNNNIGVDKTGLIARGNGTIGIDIDTAASSLSVSGNTISANNSSGIRVISGTATGTSITSNLIGVAKDGKTALPNATSGIRIESTTGVTIGGIAASSANTIAYNKGDGIQIVGNGANKNTIRINSIFANTGLGIDLDDNDVTINDANDADSGAANDGLNLPQFTQLSISGSNLKLQGCAPAGAVLDIYEADVSPTSASGVTAGSNQFTRTQDYGEGERYLTTLTEGISEDSTTLSCDTLTDADGNNAKGMSPFAWTIPLPSNVITGDALTATATIQTTGTSEYSALTNITIPQDYGDAPKTYGDAGHIVSSTLFLGNKSPDAENASKYSYNARADSNDDGMDGKDTTVDWIPLFPVLKITDTTYSVPFNVTNLSSANATLFGWIDFDKSGTFEADEGASVAVPTGTDKGSITLTWNNIPNDKKLGTTVIRTRLTSDSSVTINTPKGNAANGEVEDSPIAFSQEFPSNSNQLAIANKNPAACEATVLTDNFDDLPDGQFFGASRSNATPIRNWTASGGGTDSYARVVTINGSPAVYFGNGHIREISPALSPETLLSYDSNGKLLTPIKTFALRDTMDDSSPNTTDLPSYGSSSHWGPNPVRLTRTFTTVAGKTYRLYFSAVPEVGNDLDGMMSVEVAGETINFRTPSGASPAINYSIEFTAKTTSTTLSFVNYGHIGTAASRWCDPNSVHNLSGWCTVGGMSMKTEQAANELAVDNLKITESACATGSISGTVYHDQNANNAFAVGEPTLANVSVNVYEENGTPSNFNDDRLIKSTTTNTAGLYTFNALDTAGSYRVEIDTADTDIPATLSLSTTNPLVGITVTANTTTANQNFGFESGTIGGFKTCPAPTTSDTIAKNDYSVGWTYNTPVNTLEPNYPSWPNQQYDDTVFAAVAAHTIGSGITHTFEATTTLHVHGVDKTTMATALTAGDYLEYKFKTQTSMDPSQVMRAIAGTRYTYTKPYKFSVLLSKDNFTTYVPIISDGVAETPSAQLWFHTLTDKPYYLQPNTNYTLRVVFYGASDPDTVFWDDLSLGLGLCQDQSDAPISYGSAEHGIPPSISYYLGSAALDAEQPPQQGNDAGASASGDDISGITPDDEDGVTISTLNVGKTATLSTKTNGAAGYLQAWIDWNRDGDFLDSNEQIISNVTDNSVTDTDTTSDAITVSFTVPSTAVAGTSYARIRWSNQNNLDSQAVALNGEVEDYKVDISNAYTVYGTLFEDINYGGGAGRPASSTGTAGVNNATVELYNATTGVFVSQVKTATQDGKAGVFNLTDVPSGNYLVRVVSNTLTSTRSGGGSTEIAISTYRTDGTTPVTNEVGGKYPWIADAKINTDASVLDPKTQQFISGTLKDTYANVIQPITLKADMKDVSFGFNFDTVVNTNDAGQGSLRQALINAKLLEGETTLAQAPSPVDGALRPASKENIIFVLPKLDPNFSESQGHWRIPLTTELPYIPANTVVDARTQVPSGFGTPITQIELDGKLAGSSTNGITINAAGVTVSGLCITQFQGNGIVLNNTQNVNINSNRIGVGVSNTATGLSATFGNGKNGILVTDPAGANSIGSINTTDSNTIANNKGDGITVIGGGNTNYVSILGNSLFNNGGIGIDLSDDGVTQNDVKDVDKGANDLMNYPVTKANSFGTNGTRIVTYDITLDVPVGDYRIEFFANDTADASGYGEGKNFIGYKNLSHTAEKSYQGSFNAVRDVPNNVIVTATLTNTLAAGVFGATSEFSQNITSTSSQVCTDLLSDPTAPVTQLTVDENTTSAITLLQAKDADGNYISYLISGGSDGNYFIIESPVAGATLDCNTIIFKRTVIVEEQSATRVSPRVSTTPSGGNFEVPVDTNRDNHYELTVTATDVKGKSVTKNLTVQVVNVNETPLITTPVNTAVPEGSSSVTLKAQDPDAGTQLSYAITGGGDATQFTLNRSTGVLSFVNTPDFEQPVDSNQDNVYQIQVTVTDNGGLSYSKLLSFTVTNNAEDDALALQVRAMLQGAYSTTDKLMANQLHTLKFLPTAQPYTIAPFNYKGLETMSSATNALTHDSAPVDWVLVELRNATTPSQIVAQQAALLQRDGDVMNASTGSTTLSFAGIPAGEYVVSLRHRNHLMVLQAAPTTLSSTPTLIDFASPNTAVKGTHSRLMNETVALMWGGDVNASNSLILTGAGSDNTEIYSTVITAPENTGVSANYIVRGYSSSDTNLDGKIIITGANNDVNMFIGNIVTHPDNPTNVANFVVRGSQP